MVVGGGRAGVNPSPLTPTALPGKRGSEVVHWLALPRQGTHPTASSAARQSFRRKGVGSMPTPLRLPLHRLSKRLGMGMGMGEIVFRLWPRGVFVFVQWGYSFTFWVRIWPVAGDSVQVVAHLI